MLFREEDSEPCFGKAASVRPVEPLTVDLDTAGQKIHRRLKEGKYYE